jgi:hypothetical protein
MIYPADNKNQTRWDHNEFKVQLNARNQPRAIGFCDGTEEDLAQLMAQAELEGAESATIEKKVLKSGREIWTLG